MRIDRVITSIKHVIGARSYICLFASATMKLNSYLLTLTPQVLIPSDSGDDLLYRD